MIIGSTAIKYKFPDFPRTPKDIDIIKGSNFNDYFPIDAKREYLENPVLLKHCYCKYDDFLDADSLYTLKISHVFWDLENNSWDKHMWDIQWLKEKGCKLIKPLFDDLYKYWNEVHGKNKRSNLDMTAEQFFDNVVGFPVEHDTLHEMLIQHEYFNQPNPTYTLILKDNCEVDVDENKYNNLTELQKYNLVFEEVAVMAYERYGDMYYKAAYAKMLKKFIISHAPIWEALWIIQNHKLLLTTIPFNFKQHLDNVRYNNN